MSSPRPARLAHAVDGCGPLGCEEREHGRCDETVAPRSVSCTAASASSAHELGAVEAAVAAADLEASESVPACADCIEYKVETSRSEVSFADIDSGYAGNPPQIPDEVFALVGDLGTIAALNAGSDPPSAN